MTGASEARPSGVVTFVLSDVLDSTALWERAPAAMDRCLRRCEVIVGAAVAAHEGLVLKSRGEGDSTFSVFRRATDALHAAYAAQRSLIAEPWPDGVPFRVRVAVHTGEAVERDGDYFGPAVNRSARLRAIAEGGQVLVSRATAELAFDHLSGDVRLVELGEQQLQGVARPESVYALVGPGLPAAATAMPKAPVTKRSILRQRGVTRKEREVLAALADRLTNPEIAGRLYVSPRTVESHVSSLLRKLDAANRRELADRARELLAEDAGESGPTRGARTQLPAALELLADPATYVGRTEELRRLRELWTRACGGYCLTAVVAGEAGIGKSRLIAEIAAEVHDDGGQVLLGACFEDTQRPYEPFVHALREEATALPAPEVRRRAGVGAPALLRIVPELATALRGVLPSEEIDDAIERADVLDALLGYLSRAAEAGPVLLVIEDLHWATATTREALRHLARAGGHSPVLVAVTTRDAVPDLDETLAVFLADLARLPGIDTVTLGGLAEPEVTQLLAAVGPAADPRIVHAETGGNPLFVRELARTPGGGVGGSLAALLSRRYAQMEADDLALLDIASVLGSEFGADLLATAAERALVDVLEALERAEAAGLVAASPGRPGWFAFVHALFRAVRYDALSSARRLRLHKRVAESLEGRSDDLLLSELARHSCIAAPLGGMHEAIVYARRAGELAERALAPEEAAGHYERALSVAALLEPRDSKVRLELAVRLGEALNRSGNPRYREVLLGAADDARTLQDPVALAEVATAMIQYGIMPTGFANDPQFVAIAEEALTGLGPEATAPRARVLAALSTEVMHLDPDRAMTLACEAHEAARAVDDPVTLGQVLFSYRFAGRAPGDVSAAHAAADELISIGHRTGRKIFTITGLEARASALREAGDLGGCDRTIAECAALLGASDLPHLQAFLALYRSAHHALAGDLATAERVARDIVTLAKGGAFDPANWFGSALWTIRHNQHRLARFASFYRRGIRREPGLDDYLSAILALAHIQAGRANEARAILERLADAGFRGVRRNFLWTVKMAMLCETAEMTAAADAGDSLVHALRPHSGAIASNNVLVFEPIDLALAQAALAADRAEQAEAFAARAVAASRRRDTPIFLARELLRVAEAQRRLGATGNEIAPLVDEALHIADRTGALLIRHEAEHYGLAEHP